MPRNLGVSIAVLILTVAAQARAEPAVELADGGGTLTPGAGPGDSPSGVAGGLGLPASQVDALLAAKGIRDGNHVPVGFEYRVPNPLAERAHAAETRSAELEQRAAAAEDALASA